MKAYFSLPSFFFLDLNDKELINDKITYQKNSQFLFNINSFYGSLPFSYWNGDINNNNNNVMLYEDIYNFQLQFNIPYRLDCSNIYINEKDFYNNYMDVILTHFADSGNSIEFSTIPLYNYIKEHYGIYNYIFSKNADYIHPFDLDIINKLCEKDFITISLPIRLNQNFELLSKIENKSKIEITICNRCNNCDQRNICYIQEQQNQYNFYSQSLFSSSICNNIKFYNQFEINEIKEQIQPYLDIGITHFKIDQPFTDQKNSYNQWLKHNLFTSQFCKELN